MREGKPYAKLILHFAQLVILLSLIQAVNNHIWYTGVVDIEYTEGLAEGSGLEVELEVDRESADGSIHIDGFITYMQWQNTRNDTTIPADSNDNDRDSDSMDLKPLSEIQEELPVMAKIACSIGVLLFGLAFFNIKYRAILGFILNGFVLWICITLVVLAPLGYLGGMDFGTGTFEGEESTSSVHESSDGGIVFDLFDGELEYEFTTENYDLGLVDESEFDSVVSEAPGEDHPSYTKMDGVAGIHYSPFVVELVWAWLVLFTITPMLIGFIGRVRIEKPQRVVTRQIVALQPAPESEPGSEPKSEQEPESEPEYEPEPEPIWVQEARNLELARNWEEAAKVYEKAGMYAEAGRIRKEHLEDNQPVVKIGKVGYTILHDSVMISGANENDE